MSGAHIVLMATSGGAPNAGPGGQFTDNDPTATGTAIVSLTVSSDGTASIETTSGVQATWNWCDPPGAAQAVNGHVRVSVTGGGFTSGSATGTYLSLSTGRSWTLSSSGPAESVDFNLDIRFGDSGPAGDTATYSFDADAQ